jgi:hypothetical protein
MKIDGAFDCPAVYRRASSRQAILGGEKRKQLF